MTVQGIRTMNTKQKTPMRHSLIWKLFLSVFLCVALLLSLNLLLNRFVLPVYYRHEKEQSLQDAFYTVNTLYEAGDADALSAGLFHISNTQNISVTIWSGQRVVYQDRPDNLRDIFAFGGMELPDFGNYVIRQGNDVSGDVIRLTGRLTNGYAVSMRVPFSAIEESVAISNRFLLISGVITLLAGAAAVLLVARSFTRPIRRLSELAANVARLDFSERYTLKGSDELNALGGSINEMSDALAATISDLQVANAQLTEDNIRQQRQNEARRAFIVNVSHELKTPLALVQTYAEGLREDIAADGAEREAYCEVIEDESQKMSGLIKKMMALMQLEDGTEQLSLETFDLCELARNLLCKNAPEFARRGIRVQAPPEQPVMVTADDYLIENVLTNYLSNALHHVPDGGEIAVFFTDSSEGRVRLSVLNTGSSIPPEELPRIWESFYKVDKARTRAYGGSGIGLSLVAAIMKAHGMPYGVVNRTRKLSDGGSVCGVEFYIELPRAQEI